MLRPDTMDPQDVQDSLGVKTGPDAPPQGFPPVGGNKLLAEAGGSPTTDATGGAPAPLVSANDSRYADPQWAIIANLFTQGSLPWLQAAADVAAGRVSPDQFEQARVEHSKKMQDLMDQHPDFVKHAEDAMPLLSGVVLSAIKPAKTIAGTLAQGAAVGGPQGFVQGYTAGPAEEPSLSSERMAQGMGRGVETAVLGMVGTGTARAFSKGAEIVASRAASKAEAAASATRSERAQRSASTRAYNKSKAQKSAAEDNRYADYYENNLKEVPNTEGVSADFAKNRALLARDPETFFKQAATHGNSLAETAMATKLPPGTVAQRLASVRLSESPTPEEVNLWTETVHALKSYDAYKKLGRDVPATPPETPQSTAAPKASAKKGAAAPEPANMTTEERFSHIVQKMSPEDRQAAEDFFVEHYMAQTGKTPTQITDRDIVLGDLLKANPPYASKGKK